MPTRLAAKGLPDPPDPLHPLEEPAENRREGHIAPRHHVPEHFGEVVGPPAEFVSVVERVGKQLPVGVIQGKNLPEGLVVRYGIDNRGSLAFAEIEVQEKPSRLLSAFSGVVLFLPLDVVKDTGHMGQSDKSEYPIRYVSLFALYELTDKMGLLDTRLGW